jgi:hypothetical protein
VDGQPIYGVRFVSRLMGMACGDWISIEIGYEIAGDKWDGKWEIYLDKDSKIMQQYGDLRKNKLLLDCLIKSNRLIVN